MNQTPPFPENDRDEASKTPFDAGMIFAMAGDPAAQRMLETLRAQAGDTFSTLVDQVVETLAKDAEWRPAANRRASTMTAFRSASYQAHAAGKDRRELAEALVIGCLINIDNPDWDPFDPSTSVQVGQSALLALLQMGD